MTALLSLLADGALAAAELVALLFTAPAIAAQPADAARPIALHRLSTAADVRLLGALADVRVVQRARNDGRRAIGVAPELLAATGTDSRVIDGDPTIELGASAGGCDDALSIDRAQLTLDEAIADGLTLTPDAEATLEAIAAHALVPDGGAWRLALPAQLDGRRARALLVDQGDARFIVVVPHVAARAANLVLRPATGAVERYELGWANAGTAIVVPLANRLRFDALAAGAIELTLIGDRETLWTTVIGEVVDASAPVQAHVHE
jgi:hypothetical protein